MFFTIKLHLYLNNLQRLICHKTQQTKPNQNTLNNKVTYNNQTIQFSTTNKTPTKDVYYREYG